MKAKPKPPADRSHAGRVARGRIPVLIQLSPEARDHLDALADARGETKSSVVEGAIMRLKK